MKKYILTLFIVFSFFTLKAQTNFKDSLFHLKADVIDFRDNGILENVRANVLVNPSPKDLKVGSIFIGPDGVARKVVIITNSGNDVRIKTVIPELREVFEYFNIPNQEIQVTDADLAAQFSSTTRGVSIEKKLNEYVTVYGSLENYPSINVGGAMPYVEYKKVWQVWKWFSKSYWESIYHSGWAQAGVKLDSKLTLGLKIEYNKESKSEPKDIPLYGFSVGSGITAKLGLFATAEIEGGVSLDMPLSFDIYADVGGKCDFDGLGPIAVPNNFQKWNTFTYYPVRFEPTLKMSGEARLKIYLGCKADLFGIELFEAQVGTGPYVSIEGQLKGWVEFNRVYKITKYFTFFGFKIPIAGAYENQTTYGWEGSLSGEVGIFFKGYLEFFQEKVKVTFLDEKIPFYKFVDFSVGGSGGADDPRINIPIEQNYDTIPYNLTNSNN